MQGDEKLCQTMEAQFAVLESHVETHVLMPRKNAMKGRVELRATPRRIAIVGVQHIVAVEILQPRTVVQIPAEHVAMTIIANGTVERKGLESIT